MVAKLKKFLGMRNAKEDIIKKKNLFSYLNPTNLSTVECLFIPILLLLLLGNELYGLSNAMLDKPLLSYQKYS